jgi:3-demethoxyubiquinol 3-hydroxylase
MNARDYSMIDRLLMGFDQALRTVFGRPQPSERPNPAEAVANPELAAAERDLSARLLRIDHTGEVCAQALYQGQALTARLTQVRAAMERAAMEENDHLDWCEDRIHELGGRKSLLNPLWYAGAFLIGGTAGLVGDRWSLGFVAETEQQVGKHLDDHLQRLPDKDLKSRAILAQMQEDELRHATVALENGGAPLPEPVKLAMWVASQVMTRTVYWL